MFEYRPFVDQFLDYCRYHKKLSEKTVRAYKIDLSQYALFSDTLSKQALWDYIECLNKKYKPKTVKRKLATLKAFIHFLLLQDYMILIHSISSKLRSESLCCCPKRYLST